MIGILLTDARIAHTHTHTHTQHALLTLLCILGMSHFRTCSILVTPRTNLFKNRACPPDFFWWVSLPCQYERHIKLLKNIAFFSIELNEVGTSIKKPTSLILCDCLKNLLVSRKHRVTKEGLVTRESVSIHQAGVVCNSLLNHIFFGYR